MKVLSITLDKGIAKNLEDMSAQSGKSPENVLADVVARYIHYSGWHQDLLELSIEGAEHGDFAGPEEIKSVFTRWGGVAEPVPGGVVWSALGLRAFRKELEHLGKAGAEPSAKLAEAAWREAAAPDLAKRAFPGMTPGSLEVQLADGAYCMAFREADGKRQIIGIVSSS